MGDSTTTQPKLPVLDGTNYGYLKSKMETYIMNVNNHAWVYVITEWTPPVVETRNEEGVTTATNPKLIQIGQMMSIVERLSMSKHCLLSTVVLMLMSTRRFANVLLPLKRGIFFILRMRVKRP